MSVLILGLIARCEAYLDLRPRLTGVLGVADTEVRLLLGRLLKNRVDGVLRRLGEAVVGECGAVMVGAEVVEE